jgi:hypothetical protein
MEDNDMVENKITVMVEQEKYDELIQDHVVLMMLANTLFNSMGLGYDGKSLRIKDDDAVINFLNGAFPTRVDAVRRYLQEEEQKKEQKHAKVLKEEVADLDAEKEEEDA